MNLHTVLVTVCGVIGLWEFYRAKRTEYDRMTFGVAWLILATTLH